MTGKIWSWSVLVLVVAVVGCSPTGHPAVVYSPPASTPYHHKPRLEQQYLRAHKAGWTFVVLAFSVRDLKEAIANDGFLGSSTDMTCCEATENVTEGWYQGQNDARRFLETLAAGGAKDPTIVSGYRALQRELRKAPAVDWYVADTYDPTKIVKEVAYEGDLRIETTYRDKTRKALLRVARYRRAALDGDLEEYDANGQLSTITPYKNGLKEGVERSYSDTGALIGQVRYHQGKKQGAAVWYNESGELTGYADWLDDQQHGREIRFRRDGSCYRHLNWHDGQKHGLCVYYQHQDQLVAGGSAEYKAGVEVRQIDALSPTSQLPEEFRPAALQDFRERHRRAPNGKPR